MCQFAVDDYVGVQRVRAFVLRHVETTPSTHNRTRQVWWMTLGSSYMTCILFFLSLNAMLGFVRKYNIYLTQPCIFLSLSLNAIIRSMHTVFLDVDLQGLAVVGVVGLSFNGHEMC